MNNYFVLILDDQKSHRPLARLLLAACLLALTWSAALVRPAAADAGAWFDLATGSCDAPTLTTEAAAGQVILVVGGNLTAGTPFTYKIQPYGDTSRDPWWYSDATTYVSVDGDVCAEAFATSNDDYGMFWIEVHGLDANQRQYNPPGKLVTVLAAPTPTEAPTEVPTDTPAPTPLPTNTPLPTATPLPTNTPTALPTLVPTNTPLPTATPLPTNTPTTLPTLVPTNTPLPTATPLPTNTPTALPTLVPTNTPLPTATPLPTNTPTARPTLVPTNTPVPTALPTNTPSPTATPLPTNTLTTLPTLAPTNTPLPTATTPAAGPTSTPTALPTLVPTNTPLPTATSLPPATPTSSVTVIEEEEVSAEPTQVVEPVSSPIPAPTELPAAGLTPASRTALRQPTATALPTIEPGDLPAEPSDDTTDTAQFEQEATPGDEVISTTTSGLPSPTPTTVASATPAENPGLIPVTGETIPDSGPLPVYPFLAAMVISGGFLWLVLRTR